MLRRRSSTFLLPLCLMYQLLLDGWSLHGITKKKRRPTGSLEQVTLKSRPFFIYLRTYLALRMRRSFLIGEHWAVLKYYVMGTIFLNRFSQYIMLSGSAFLAAAYLNDIHTHSLVKIKLYGRGHSFFFYSCYET